MSLWGAGLCSWRAPCALSLLHHMPDVFFFFSYPRIDPGHTPPLSIKRPRFPVAVSFTGHKTTVSVELTVLEKNFKNIKNTKSIKSSKNKDRNLKYNKTNLFGKEKKNRKTLIIKNKSCQQEVGVSEKESCSTSPALFLFLIVIYFFNFSFNFDILPTGCTREPVVRRDAHFGLETTPIFHFFLCIISLREALSTLSLSSPRHEHGDRELSDGFSLRRRPAPRYHGGYAVREIQPRRTGALHSGMSRHDHPALPRIRVCELLPACRR